MRYRSKVSALLCDITICVSNAARDSLVNDYLFPAKSTITIHNGVAASDFFPADSTSSAVRTKLGIQPGDFVLVCTARLVESKGVDILLQAMTRLLHDGLLCKCIIVGDGPLKAQLLKQSTALGLTNRVFFEGFQDDVRPYLQAGNVFVFTSLTEGGTPFSVLEAMACGLPCVVSDVGGNAEAITHGKQGFVVKAGCVNETAEAIAYLANHPHERNQMSGMARHRVSELFDIESKMAEVKRVILA